MSNRQETVFVIKDSSSYQPILFSAAGAMREATMTQRLINASMPAVSMSSSTARQASASVNRATDTLAVSAQFVEMTFSSKTCIA